MALIAVAGASLLLVSAGYVMVHLASDGHVVVNEPPQHSLTEGELYEALLWQAAKTVPLIDLPGTLGWENPVHDPGAPLGVALVVTRVVITVGVVGAAVRLYRTGRARRLAL